MKIGTTGVCIKVHHLKLRTGQTFKGVPVNNITCCQRPEHELNEAKTRVLNSCSTRDSVSSISRVPLGF